MEEMKELIFEIEEVNCFSLEKIEVCGRTTIFWFVDGTVVPVRRTEDDRNDLQAAFCAACTKKIFGTASALRKTIQLAPIIVKDEPARKKKAAMTEEQTDVVIEVKLEHVKTAPNSEDVHEMVKDTEGEENPEIDESQKALKEHAANNRLSVFDKEYIKERYFAGDTTSSICTELGKSYQNVYGYIKKNRDQWDREKNQGIVR